jgi:hypothetical protein
VDDTADGRDIYSKECARCKRPSPVAQSAAQCTVNAKVDSSNLSGRGFIFILFFLYMRRLQGALTGCLVIFSHLLREQHCPAAATQ